MFFSMLDLFLGLIGLALNLGLVGAILIVLFLVYSVIVFAISDMKANNMSLSEYIVDFVKERL